MLRVEMLHQHETHAGIERQILEQFRERLQPAGGSANANDGKVVWSSALKPRVWGCTLSPGSCVCLADIEREDVERFLRFNPDAFLSFAPPLETFLRVFDFIGLASLAERSGFGAQHSVIW